MGKNWRDKVLRHALKNRKHPSENRKRVGKNLSLLAVFLFFVFLINFAVIIGTDKKFGETLSAGAKRVHQTVVKVPARRGTIFDRNGQAIAEDATSIMFLPSSIRTTNQLREKSSMSKSPSLRP